MRSIRTPAAPDATAAAAASIRVWRMLPGADATGALCMERMTSPPFGLLGGKAGAAAVVKLTTPDGARRVLPSKGAFAAPAGSAIEMITPGSGGFGPVAERDPAAIGRDLLDGYVSAAAAERDYGIANPEALRKAAEAEDAG